MSLTTHDRLEGDAHLEMAKKATTEGNLQEATKMYELATTKYQMACATKPGDEHSLQLGNGFAFTGKTQVSWITYVGQPDRVIIEG